MLFVSQNNQPEQTWHIGEPLPVISHQVVTFQADGEELELFTLAMRGTNKMLDSLVSLI